MTILLCLLVAREALQFSVNPTQYLSSIENVLEIMLMVLTFVLLLNGPPGCNIDFKREIATFVLLISWILLVTLIGKNLCNHKANSKFYSFRSPSTNVIFQYLLNHVLQSS